MLKDLLKTRLLQTNVCLSSDYIVVVHHSNFSVTSFHFVRNTTEEKNQKSIASVYGNVAGAPGSCLAMTASLES